MAGTKLDMPDYKTTEHLINKYSATSLLKALEPINASNNKQMNGTLAGSQTSLDRNDFGIVSTLLKKYDIASVENAIINLTK